MRYLCTLLAAVAVACSPLACRKLELDPRSTLTADEVYQDYTVDKSVTYNSSAATVVTTFDAVFRLGSKNGLGVALPQGSTVSCNGAALVKAFGAGTSVSYHLASSTVYGADFAFVWTEADGTTHKNTIVHPTASAAFETPPTTISRSAALQLHWSDSTPSSSTLIVGFAQPSGQTAAPTIVRGAAPSLEFSVTAMGGLGVGPASLTTRAGVVSPLLAPTAAGGQRTYTDTFNYPVSVTN